MLWQQPGIQALQVLNSKKQWIDATPIPGTLVIKYVTSHEGDRKVLTCWFSIGDQLARWTSEIISLAILSSMLHNAADDIFRSTVHRATSNTGVPRYSVPLFFGTDYHVPIEVCWHAFSLNSAHVPSPLSIRLRPYQVVSLRTDLPNTNRSPQEIICTNASRRPTGVLDRREIVTCSFVQTNCTSIHMSPRIPSNGHSARQFS